MEKIAIALSKGGVGKTTTAVNLAAGLARADCRTLIVDSDAQNHVAAALGVKPAAGLAEVMNGETLAAAAIIEARPNLYLLAGGHRLAGVSKSLSQQDLGAERVLSDSLASLDGAYQYALVDTGPGWSPMMLNVLHYARRVLIPIELEALALQSLVEFAQRIESVNRYWPVELAYILPTSLDRRRRQSTELLAQVQAVYGDRVCTPIRSTVKLSECSAYGQTIYEYAPRSPGAEDYQALTERILSDAHAQADAQHA